MKKNVIVTTALFILIQSPAFLFAQIKPSVSCIGGDDVPLLKKKIESSLQTVLLEMNRVNKGTGQLVNAQKFFANGAYSTFENFVLQNAPYTARKQYEPQLVYRRRDETWDTRGITVKVNLNGTEASENQNLIFSFSKNGLITDVRMTLPNYDYHRVIASGKTTEDSLTRGIILDFIERFRMAYNTKNIDFLEKVYSDDALIITGTVLKPKEHADDLLRSSYLTEQKIRLVQMTKQEYIEALRTRAFKSKAFLNVKFDSLQIIRHATVPDIYGITCQQYWNTATYKDRGYLFLMMDFRDKANPIIHVRTWQPHAFTEDNRFVDLYDFQIVTYKRE